MKILVFTSLYPNNVQPNHGVFVKERVAGVAKLGNCLLTVAAPIPYYPPIRIGWRRSYLQVAARETIDGIAVCHPRYLMTPKVGMFSYGFTMFLSVLPTIRRIHDEFDFDLIDGHFVYPDGMAAVLLGRYFRKPVVLSARGSDINVNKDLPFIRSLVRFTLTRASKVISVSQALNREVMNFGIPSEKTTVIPNGVDSEMFRPIPKREVRQKLGLPLEKRMLLSAGGLVPGKGFDLLIKAVRILLDENGLTDVYLCIVGGGPLRSELERVVISLGLHNHVRLVGPVAHQHLPAWYNASDLFCLASSREGWPNVLMEAIACGRPVVTTKVGGVAEIVRSENIGLFTERTPSDIAEAITVALGRKWNPAEIREHVRNRTWEEAGRRVVEVFESVCGCSLLPKVS